MSFKPVDLNFAGSIIQAFQAGVNQKRQREQDALAKKHDEEQLQLQKDKFKAEQDELKDRHQRQDAEFKMTQDLHEFGKQKQLNELAEKYQELGILPGGAKATKPEINTPAPIEGMPLGAQSPSMQGFSLDPSLTSDQVKLDFPNLGSTTALSHDAVIAQKAKDLETVNRPTEEMRSRLAREADERSLNKQIDLQKLKNIEEQLKFREQIQSNEKIAAGHDAARLNAAKSRNTSTQTKNQALRISNQFDTHPITKRYNLIKEATQAVNSVPDNTQNPGDDQQLIYAFAKVMDPESVVREGEYNTVQKYSQSMADRFHFAVNRINSNTPFLTPEARSQLKSTITNRAKIEESAYKNLKTETGKKLQNLGEDPKNWLIEYGDVIPGNVTPGKKVGDTRVINGKTQTWDGTGWEQ